LKELSEQQAEALLDVCGYVSSAVEFEVVAI